MKIFNYDKNGVFVSESKSRDVKGEAIIPANATKEVPPKEKSGYVRVFKGDKWGYVIDNRNSKVWSKETKQEVIVDYIGEIDSAYTDVQPSKFDVWSDGSWVEDSDARKVSAELSLIALADTKQQDAQKLILGYKATTLQIERYKDKYERAKEGEFDDATNQVIIQKFEYMRSAIRQFTDMIEEYRGFVDDLIQAGELDKAEKAIEAGESFGAETTKADIEALLGGL